jgi:hypothetical protein
MNTPKRVSNQCCHRGNCRHKSEAVFEWENFCRQHFIEVCYLRLDQIAEQIRRKEFRGAVCESSRRLLLECTRQVASEAFSARRLNNLDRSRLLDILFFASNLANRLRRSKRISHLVPVRLINPAQKTTWIEDTVTQNLSKHGAMLRCTHAYESGETVGLMRLDTGDRALARVVWRERTKFAQHKLAVEILNSANFWNWQPEARGSL